ncbi:MAG: hypothetical protein AAB383_06155 [Patescibacteria group bacterium]
MVIKLDSSHQLSNPDDFTKDILSRTDARAKAARLSGFRSDHASAGFGIRAYLSQTGLNKLPDDVEATLVTTEPQMPVYCVELPKGSFMVGSGIHLSRETTYQNENATPQGCVSLDYGDVVRIEGAGEKLYQNWQYDWNFNPVNR